MSTRRKKPPASDPEGGSQFSFSNALHASSNLLDLDPELIDPSFVADRQVPFEQDSLEDRTLLESMRVHGQQSPILVRPHPDRQGRYQVAYGHRRLRASRSLNRTVKALVRSLTDEELVIAQGQENAERRDLSFIERAQFAARLERLGFSRKTILDAIGIDKADLSRLISIVQKTPQDLLDAIGPAPSAGRPRWLAFAERLTGKRALARARSLTSDAQFLSLASDARFARMLAEVSPADPSAADRKGLVVDEDAIGSIKITAKSTTIRIDASLAPDFGAYLEHEIPEIYRAWKEGRQNR